MRRTPRRLLLLALAAGATLAAAAPAPAAEMLYTVSDQNELLSFGSDSPAALHGGEKIYGLGQGERIVDLDLRPRTDELYGVSNAGRVYRINPGSGRALAVGTGPFAPALESPSLAADFDGVADRIRIVNDADQNLRVNPNDGAAAEDARLTFASDDRWAGTNPHVIANAYSPATAEARDNVEYLIDDVQRSLLTQDVNDPSILHTVAPLTLQGSGQLPQITGPVGFDIAADGRAYVTFRPEAGTPAQLFRLDLATGQLRPLGSVGTSRIVTAGLAAAGTVPDDTLPPLVLAAAPANQRLVNVVRRGLRFELSCDETCQVTGSLRIRNQVLARGGLILAGPGKDTLRFRVTAAAARRIVRSKFRRITLHLIVIDAAGNRRVQSENVSLVP